MGWLLNYDIIVECTNCHACYYTHRELHYPDEVEKVLEDLFDTCYSCNCPGYMKVTVSNKAYTPKTEE